MSAIKYKVKPGDVLSIIAKHNYGNSHLYIAIAHLNGIKPPYVIQPGQWIELPATVQGAKRLTHGAPGGGSASPNPAGTPGAAPAGQPASATGGATGSPGAHAASKGHHAHDKAVQQILQTIPKDKLKGQLADWLRYGRIHVRDGKPPTSSWLPTFKTTDEFRKFMKSVEQLAWDLQVYQDAPDVYTQDKYPDPGYEPHDQSGKKVTKDRFRGMFTQ
jgi:LysM repeat protein